MNQRHPQSRHTPHGGSEKNRLFLVILSSVLSAGCSLFVDVLHPESKQQTTPAAPRDALECVARWPARANAGKTASALRIADLKSTDSTCSSSSATWNDVRFELKHRPGPDGRNVSNTHNELDHR